MMKKITIVLSLGLAITMTAHAKRVLLKVPTSFATNLIGLGTGAVTFKKQVESMTKDIKVKLYEPNKLIAAFEILDAVSTGKINAGWTIAGYWQGKIPAAPLFSAVPFGPEAPEYAAWMYYGNGWKLYQEMYDSHGYNVKVIPCAISAPETAGWFQNEITSVQDFDGLKIRFFGLGGEVMKRLGASVTLLPGGEIFPALEKGAIDASEFSIPIVDVKLGFYKIAKYNYFPGWHQQATLYELLINKKTWNAMDKYQKGILQVACKATMMDTLAETEATQGEVIRDNLEKRGVIVKKLSPAMLAEIEAVWKEVIAEKSAQNAFFQKVYTDLKGFRENYNYWKINGFLPR